LDEPGKVFAYDTFTGAMLASFSVSEAVIALGPDGDTLAVVGFKDETEQVISLRRLSKGNQVNVAVKRHIESMLDYRNCVLKFSPDGGLLVAAYKDRKVLEVGYVRQGGGEALGWTSIG
jgi:WD40 repeat protein